MPDILESRPQITRVERVGDQTFVARGENELAARGSALAAATSAAVALAAAGPNYANTAAGLAATASGGTFAVDNGNGTITVYLDNAGVAVALRTMIKDPSASTAAGLIGAIQAGAGAVPLTLESWLRGTLHAHQFGVVMDAVTDDTAAWQKAIVAARTQGKVLICPPGRTVVSDELVDGSILNSNDDPALIICGQGRNATVFVNKCLGKSPFNIGNTYFTELSNFKIEGNGLTGASGNSHAIDMRDPNFGSGTYLPGFVDLRRLWITGHRGNAVRYDGAAMPACGIYSSGGLQLVSDGVLIQTCTIGAYLYQCNEPKFHNLVLDGNYTSGLVDDGNEKLCIDTAVLVNNDAAAGSGLITLHDGTTIKAGSYVHNYSRGSTVRDSKLKGNRYASMSIKGSSYPLIEGNWFLLTLTDECEIYVNQGGVRLIGNTFELSPPTGGARSIVKIVLGGGIDDFGNIQNNLVQWYGGGNVAQIFDIDGSAAGSVRGTIRDNVIGGAVAPGNACVVTDAIRVSGNANGVRIVDNRITALTNVTVTDAIDLTGCAQMPYVIDGNIALANGGTITKAINPVMGWALDPASIADGDSLDSDQSLPGAVLGDIVLGCSFSLDLQGLTLSAAITATNTITFTFTNCTGAPVDLGSGALSAKVVRKT